MNDSLIKRLELAIQVESGEVPLSEVEARLRHQYVSEDKNRMSWFQISPLHTPINWNHKEYEYRKRGDK